MSRRDEINQDELSQFLENKKNGVSNVFMDKPILITFNVELGLREALREMAYSKNNKLSELLREICEEAVAKHFGVEEAT